MQQRHTFRDRLRELLPLVLCLGGVAGLVMVRAEVVQDRGWQWGLVAFGLFVLGLGLVAWKAFSDT